MNSKNGFWHLEDSKKIETEKKFYELLEEYSQIINVSYMPNDFQSSNDSRKFQITDKEFKQVNFSHTYISGFVFSNCVFKHCLFIGTTIENCEFHNCKFILTNTYKFAIANTYINPTSFRNCLKRRQHQNIGVHLYQILLRNSRATRQIEFERDAQFLFLRWKRYQDTYEIKKLTRKGIKSLFSKDMLFKCLGYLGRLTWEKIFGSGLRPRYFVQTVIFTIMVFCLLNYNFREEFGLQIQSEPVSSWVEALYFTLISFTTLGYGDIVPSTEIGQIVASLQSFIGFFLLALLVAMLYRKISP